MMPCHRIKHTLFAALLCCCVVICARAPRSSVPTTVTTDICSIDRRAACDGGGFQQNCLSMKEFRARYVERRPVLIGGLIDDWLALNPPHLAGKYPEAVVRLAHGSMHTYTGTTEFANVSQLPDALNLLARESNLLVVEDDFVFDQFPQLLQEFSTPSWFSSFSSTPTTADSSDGMRPVLALGGKGSGLPWHVQGQAWPGLAYGRKQWFVAAPDKLANAARGHPLASASRWLNSMRDKNENVSHRSRSRGEPMQCVQHAGEVMYIPAAWPRLTVNVDGLTVAVGAVEKKIKGGSQALAAGIHAGTIDALMASGHIAEVIGNHKLAQQRYRAASSTHPAAAKERVALLNMLVGTDGGHYWGAEELAQAHVVIAEVEAAVEEAASNEGASQQLLASILRDAAIAQLGHIGEIEEAYKNLRRATQFFAADPEIAFLAGNAAERAGRAFDARFHFSTCVNALVQYSDVLNGYTATEAVIKVRRSTVQLLEKCKLGLKHAKARLPRAVGRKKSRAGRPPTRMLGKNEL